MSLLSRAPQADFSAADALALADAVLAIARVDNLRTLARTACAQLRTLLPCDGATFVLREGDEVHYAEEDAVGRLWKGRRFPASACISGWAIHNARSAVVEDIYTDRRIPLSAYRPTFVKSLVMTPVGTAEPVAALGAYWSRSHAGTAREQLLVEGIAEAVHGVLRRCRRDAQRSPETAGAAGEQLLAVVAHDLRNPLTAILNTTTALQGGVDAGLAAELTGRIRRSAERASRLVEQLQAYSRLASGGLSLALGTARLDRLCQGVVDEIRRVHPDCQIHVSAAPVSGLWDAERLGAAMLNLVKNAVVHGDERAPVEVHAAARGEEAMVQVRNQGAPIPAALQAKIFEPFTHAARRGDSLGLGLYIAQQIAEAHGGRIDLRSGEDEGTTFTLRVPLHASMLEPSTD